MRAIFVTLLLSSLSGCGDRDGAVSSDSDPAPSNGGKTTATGSGGEATSGVEATSGGSSSIDDPSDDDVTTEPTDVEPVPVDGTTPTGATAGTQPLRRLSHFEYGNTLRDLFPMLAVDVPTLALDESIDGFSNNWDGMQPSDLLTEQYLGAAQGIARQLDDAVISELGGCTSGAGCAEQFVANFGARAYRRPLTQEEIDEYLTTIFDSGPGGSDLVLGMQLTLMAMLQSPYFLYRPEFGAGTTNPTLGKRLTPYETASRLSYLFWASMPDQDLFDAAAAGGLDDEAGVQAEAQRLLSNPKAREGVTQFMREWLKLGKVNLKLKLPEANWDEAFRLQLEESMVRFVYDEVFAKGGASEDLLTSTHFPATPEIAALFGQSMSESGWGAVDANPTERSGLLTHPGFLGAHGYGEYGSPVLRGVYVMDRILCSPPSPPPADVAIIPPESPATVTTPRTNREAYVQATTGAGCDACHTAINGFGFAFEHYDTLGQYRDEDSGFPVDASGSLGSYQFNDAVELSAQLAASDPFQACVVKRWARYALGGSPLAFDPVFLDDLTSDFSSSGHALEKLLLSIATHERFALWLATEAP